MGNVTVGRLMNSLGDTLSLRKYWPIWALSLVLGVVDISNRFVSKSDHQEVDEFWDNSLGIQEISVLPTEKLERYMEKLAENTEQPEPELESIVSSITEAIEEREGLGFWTGAGNDYQLLAIFSAVEKFAVLSRADNETGESEIVEVREGDLMGGFVVSQISEHTLTLNGPENERADLMLFRPLSDQLIRSDSSSSDRVL
jgi:hypothetical protein